MALQFSPGMDLNAAAQSANANPAQLKQWYEAAQKAATDYQTNAHTDPNFNYQNPQASTQAALQKQGLDSFENWLGQDKQRQQDAQQFTQAQQSQKIQGELQDFYKQMTAPLDPNDAYTQRVLQMAGGQGRQAVTGAGFGGAAGNAASEQMAVNAGTQLQQQRQALGLQAQGMASQSNASAGQLQQGYQQLGQQAQQFNYNNNLAQAQGLGGAIGGALGSVAQVGLSALGGGVGGGGGGAGGAGNGSGGGGGGNLGSAGAAIGAGIAGATAPKASIGGYGGGS